MKFVRSFLPVSPAQIMLIVMVQCLFVFSCNNDYKEPEPKGEVIVEGSEMRPYQAVVINVNDLTLTKDTYEGTIGGEIIYMEKVNASTLIFEIPGNLPEGMSEIAFLIEGEEYTKQVNILASIPVLDAVAVFESYYADLTSDSAYAGIDMTDLDATMTEFYSLSPDEQMIEAQCLVNNKILLDNFFDEIITFENTAGLSFSKTAACNKQCVVSGLNKLMKAAQETPFTAFLASGIITYRILKYGANNGLAKLRAAVNSCLELGYFAQVKLASLTYEKAQNLGEEIDLITNQKVSALPEILSIENNQEIYLSIKIAGAPYISEENRSKIPVVDEFFNYYLKFKEQLSGFYTLPQPKTGTIEGFAEDLSGFAISTDNPKVTVSAISGTPDLAKVKFTTNETADQEFTFTYSYTNEEGETSGFNQKVKLTAIEDIKTGWYDIICGGGYKTWKLGSCCQHTYFSDFTVLAPHSGGVSELLWSYSETDRTLEVYFLNSFGNRIGTIYSVLVINNSYMKLQSLDEYESISEWIAE